MNYFKNDKPIVCIQGLGYVGSAMAIAVSSILDNNNENVFNVIGCLLYTSPSPRDS